MHFDSIPRLMGGESAPQPQVTCTRRASTRCIVNRKPQALRRSKEGMRKFTHYELLGVRQDAAPAEIKKAFRKKVKLYHPDHTPGVDGSRFQAIVEAWDILSDPIKRRIYDRELLNSARAAYPFRKFD